MDWETELVIRKKLDPALANKHVLKHPVVIQRAIMASLMQKNQIKVTKYSCFCNLGFQTQNYLTF